MSQQNSSSDTLRNMLLAGAIFMAVMMIGPKLLPPSPKSVQGPEPPTSGSTAPTGADAAGKTVAPTTDAPPAGVTSDVTAPRPEARGTGGVFRVDEAEEERTLTIGSAGPDQGVESDADPYRMQLVLSNVGASVMSATLTDHAETLGSDERYRLLAAAEREGRRSSYSLAVEKLNVDGEDISLDDKRWHIKTGDGGAGGVRAGDVGDEVEFFLDVVKDEQPVLRLTRRYLLPKQAKAAGRHDLTVELSIENLSGDRSHTVVLAYRGGLGIRGADSRMDDRVVDAGLRAQDGRVAGTRTKLTGAAQSPAIYAAGESGETATLSWAATANKYFTCTLAPKPKSNEGAVTRIAEVSAVDIDGDPVTDDDVTVRFVTRSASLAAGQRLTYPVDVYIGEKDAHAFRTVPEYVSRNYYYQLSQGFGFCTFTWLVELMVWLLNGLHFVVHDYGVAIIILVLIVRTMLHPITKKGQVNMVRMQTRMGAFAPKLEEIKKKFANDKARQQQETMKLYREEGINPAGQLFTCLPMVIQMPIWVALYISLSNNILMRHEAFLFTWIRDLTAQDCLYQFASPIVIPLVNVELTCFNLLPILLGIAMYTQQKLQPKPKPNPNASDQQRQQQEMMQKMMPMMSIMMLVIFYKMPSGLNLYIMTSSFVGTYEQYRIRKHIRAQEEAGTFTAPATSKPDAPQKPRKPSFFQKLQAMAEDARKIQGKKRGKTPRR